MFVGGPTKTKTMSDTHYRIVMPWYVCKGEHYFTWTQHFTAMTRNPESTQSFPESNTHSFGKPTSGCMWGLSRGKAFLISSKSQRGDRRWPANLHEGVDRRWGGREWFAVTWFGVNKNESKSEQQQCCSREESFSLNKQDFRSAVQPVSTIDYILFCTVFDSDGSKGINREEGILTQVPMPKRSAMQT